MQLDDSIRNRTAEFARNTDLETLLTVLGEDLGAAEEQAVQPYRGQVPALPPVFVMGPPRCGSTLFTQWLAATGHFSYPTNLLSRFWVAPIVGARIQELLTNSKYDFRNELYDLQYKADFSSNHGKTEGALAPNEFWYFWRRFMLTDDYQSRAELEKVIDVDILRGELAGITSVLGKPFATKGMIFNEHIPLIADIIPNAIFVWIKRCPEFNVQSLLKARQRQYGDMAQWYSFRIRDYPILSELPPVESVCGQIASIHNSIESGLNGLPSERTLSVDYARFCQEPNLVYRALAERLDAAGYALPAYAGPTSFEVRDQWRLDWVSRDEVERAFKTA